MRFEDYDMLSSILNEFCREKSDLEVQIEHNLKCMKMADVYMDSYVDSLSDDFKIFSPRRTDTEEKRRIDNVSKEKAAYEEINKKLLERKDILIDYVEKLENLLKYERVDDTEKNEYVENMWSDTILNLDTLVQRMEVCCSYIEKKPVQAKQDFIVIGRCLKEITYKLRDYMKGNI